MNNIMKSNNPHVYVIIGATGGIGSELSRLLASEGSKLVLCSNNDEKLGQLAQDIGVDSFKLDAADFEQVDECIN